MKPVGNAFLGPRPRNISSLDFTPESSVLPRPGCRTGPAGVTHRSGHLNQHKSWAFLPLPLTKIYSGSVPTPGNKGSLSCAVLETENTPKHKKTPWLSCPRVRGVLEERVHQERVTNGSVSASSCWGLVGEFPAENLWEKSKNITTRHWENVTLEERWYKICVVSAETGVWRHLAKLHVRAYF